MQFRFLTHAFEVVFKPFKQILAPIPASHVMNGLSSIAAVLSVVFCPLVGIIVFPLAKHATNIKPGINEHLIPREYLVGVDVPILHSLYPIYAAVVVGKSFRNVFPLFVVIRHVRVQFTHAISDRPCKKSFDNIRTYVVQIISIVIYGATKVIHVHDLAACFSTPVLVE